MEIKTQQFTYSDDLTTFEGLIAWNDSFQTVRPVVMVAHTYKGQSEFEVEKCVALAQIGYLAFAVDMYGQGIRASTPEEAQSLMDVLNNDRALLLARIQLALNNIKTHPLADEDKLAAIVFCFGGKCVLDLARSGEEIKGVISFHGVYDQPPFKSKQNVKASILVLHGWEDPLAQPHQTVALAEELTERNADWTIMAFGNTGHAFTNTNANDRKGGMFYNQLADKRSWQQMTTFLEELFV